MSAKKPKRPSPAVDMTAMVDVAFLLLTFFILTTTKFREDQKVEIDSPSSVSITTVPEKGLMTVYIGPEGEIFAGFSDIDTRIGVIQKAIGEKELEITESGVQYFSTLQNFGVPIKDMPVWLGQSTSEALMEYEHVGIPSEDTDSTTNDLKDLVRWGRLTDQRMRFAIKGDVNSSYAQVSQVISTLQDWNINQFSLITTMEEGGVGEDELASTDAEGGND